MKHLQKAFSAPSPRLIAVVQEESGELLEQLQQASRANAELAVILAVAKDSQRLLDFYKVPARPGVTLLLEDPKAAGGAAATNCWRASGACQVLVPGLFGMLD